MKSVNILAVSNGVGITRDMQIIKDVLVKAGYEVETNHTFRWIPNRKFDLAIHLERFQPKLFSSAEKNVLIPNQEWFEPGWLPALPGFHTVFTKTQFATRVFKDLGARTEFISFTSEDRYLPDAPKSDFHFLHLAGKSVQKQTETVFKTWEKNPGFPQLTIIQDPKFFKPRVCARNINFMSDRVPEHLLKTIQNTCAVHVCPSETEGFGHYIMEAMSCKSLVLTTKGEPMTELVTPERGMTIDTVGSAPMRLSIKWLVSPETIEKSVIEAIVMEERIRHEMGEKAREYFLENDAFFRRRLLEAVAEVFQ